ncbi:MAG: hypothetical protein IH985_04380 [Planctomycetes bacterium]|nr:hypothetical protein [Planctomycetota bacterium]
MHLSATQKGAVGESVVAARLILESDGRLAPYVPFADDRGVDLLVLDKQTGRTIPLQIKTRTGTVKRKSICHFQVRSATFDPRAWLLAVMVDYAEGDVRIKMAWLMPMKKLSKITKVNKRNNYVIRPSPNVDSKDMYTPYRCRDMAQVVSRLYSALEA